MLRVESIGYVSPAPRLSVRIMIASEAKNLRKDSISTRFAIATLLTVVCMSVLVWSQVYFEKKLGALHQQKITLLELSNTLLQIRRHEKDFISRNDVSYLSLLEERSNSFKRQLAALQPTNAVDDSNAATILASIASFTDYEETLKLVASKIRQIGFSENDGVQKKFRQSIHKLETALNEQHDNESKVLMLQIRRAEKDFMLRKRLEYVAKLDQFSNLLESRLKAKNQGELLSLLNAYRQNFSQLASAYQELGLTHEDGLRLVFRQASHGLEQTLSDMNDTLAPQIIQKEAHVKQSRMTIIAINLLLLLFLMLNSFRSIKVALKSFTAFFKESKTDMKPLDTEQFNLHEFKSMAEMANAMIEARQTAELNLQVAMKDLSEANTRLTDLASKDGLTQLPNRRELDRRLNEEWYRALRTENSLAIVLIDIDHFKAYNDHYGHAQGDNALIRVANILAQVVYRSGDFVARYGGEEFLVILPNTDSPGALYKAQEIVTTIENTGIAHEASTTTNVLTVSAGVFSAKPAKDLSTMSWITKADNALYLSKERGRNQATLF